MNKLQRSAIVMLTVLLTGCGSATVGPRTNGTGNIIVTNLATGAQITSSAQAPYQVQNTFSIGVAESDYNGGTFNATIISYNNACFSLAQITNLTSTAFKLSATPTTTNNPCVTGTTEQVLIEDTRGHSAMLYFELMDTVVLSS